ncbi:flagellin lysine-N-methylase [Paenibacillus sp. OV219]|uniref:flagellin lysine-N-methylase n=1 Tax=Paenibacillus sp. OV219 TaxID=1884377 RepID=UPI0008D30A7A|nr:flagellin lysine-N-methylase [Paenibacillus sp. OV219]SEM79973.1 lysine-N-methylase [Paenibacillus sp. OV219]
MRTLVPDYYEKFTCIGSACEDTCCSGWSIAIDEQTLKKYKRVPKQQLDIMSGVNGKSFKTIEANCHFLTEEKLCRIQATLGEAYLSHTCDKFPRSVNVVDGVKEASATLACPEIARLVLFNPNGIDVNYTEEEIELPVDKRFKPDPYMNIVRDLVLGILQDRRYAVDDRMVILAMYFNDLVKYKGLEDEFLHGDFRDVLRDVSGESASQFQIVRDILHILKDEQKEAARYKALIASVDGYLGGSNSSYAEAYAKHYKPFMESNAHILENFLVNYAYRTVDFSKSIESFFLMTVLYAMLKYHLIGIAGAHKGLTEELVVDTIQPFMKRFEHHPGTAMITSFFKKNGYFSLADFIRLIKN